MVRLHRLYASSSKTPSIVLVDPIWLEADLLDIFDPKMTWIELPQSELMKTVPVKTGSQQKVTFRDCKPTNCNLANGNSCDATEKVPTSLKNKLTTIP